MFGQLREQQDGAARAVVGHRDQRGEGIAGGIKGQRGEAAPQSALHQTSSEERVGFDCHDQPPQVGNWALLATSSLSLRGTPLSSTTWPCVSVTRKV